MEADEGQARNEIRGRWEQSTEWAVVQITGLRTTSHRRRRVNRKHGHTNSHPGQHPPKRFYEGTLSCTWRTTDCHTERAPVVVQLPVRRERVGDWQGKQIGNGHNLLSTVLLRYRSGRSESHNHPTTAGACLRTLRAGAGRCAQAAPLLARYDHGAWTQLKEHRQVGRQATDRPPKNQQADSNISQNATRTTFSTDIPSVIALASPTLFLAKRSSAIEAVLSVIVGGVRVSHQLALENTRMDSNCPPRQRGILCLNMGSITHSFKQAAPRFE
jgi:hypothetical protein